MESSAWSMETCVFRGSNEINEDVLIVNSKNRIFGVVDGATSVNAYRDEKGKTGGYLAANLLASFFTDAQDSENLVDVVQKANRELRSRMINSNVDVSNKKNLWSAAFAVFRISDTRIEYVQAGDCMLFAKYDDGTVRALTHDQVAHLDFITISKREEAKKNGCVTREEIFQYILPTVSGNRQKANTLQGYSVMNGEPELDCFLESGIINRACLKRLYAVTDGLFYPGTRADGKMDWNHMLSRIDETGLEAYAEQLILLEESDPQCNVYPRIKRSDDKTGIVIDF
ncbi:protein phosphatase 2C domain-containing protein [Paenibacillus alkaliterrae]|uniref:protein phosphatase 2C domain-containing protein n=1 Tax=Paenibacillus alkaliterrae TaxID=320909 RepID=UPI001F37B87E|nr:protein phosphatase 2C domain-containing protein [Paenibacillus alkaliterrae]MCF2941318.1 protein phosphatase 2C domain-containing protein [Paenibacillus alkaliterrae]